MDKKFETQVTIIIPHYNSPRKLERLLNTIPDKKELQVIVVDDLSTKETEVYDEVRQKYEGYVEFYQNEVKQKSAGGARNIGLKHARGKWILFADADDWFLPDFYHVIESYFNSDADMIFFACTSVKEGTDEPAERHLVKMQHNRDYVKSPERETELWFRYKYHNPWSRLIRRQMIEEHRLTFDIVKYSNDLVFSAKCGYYAKKIDVCSLPIYCITDGEGTLTNNDDPEEDSIRDKVYMRYQWFLCSKLNRADAATLGYHFIDKVYVYLHITKNPVFRFMFYIAKSMKDGGSVLEKIKKLQWIKDTHYRVMNVIFSMMTMISPSLNTKMRYKRVFGKELNLENPQTLNEKLLWLKLKCYMTDPLVIQCADKYRVREYVAQCGCEKNLIELIGVYDKVDEIPWNELPDQFVLKWNFGSGMNIICSNKADMDKEEVITRMRKWGKCKYWLAYAEMQYKRIPKKIICERLLACDQTATEWKAPEDYKVYCFNGVPEFVMVCVGREENRDPLYFYYDREWNRMPYSYEAYEYPDYVIEKPACLEELFECAAILAKPFPFVRADFYCVNDKVYFGELTFTPSGGMDDEMYEEADLKLGSMLNLEKNGK